MRPKGDWKKKKNDEKGRFPLSSRKKKRVLSLQGGGTKKRESIRGKGEWALKPKKKKGNPDAFPREGRGVCLPTFH